MTDINKQKFLAELGKLLTFMYEEDRQTALAMYGKMFDDTDDEQGLIQFLVSPTRQAVVIARTYNARARKLQVESQSRMEDDSAEAPGAAPDFVLAIDRIYQQYFPAQDETEQVMANQFSLFEDGGQFVQDGLDELYPVLERSAPAAEEPPAEPAPAEEPASGEEAPAYEPPRAETAEASEGEVSFDEVDSFLEDFSFAEELPAELPPEEAPAEAAEEPEAERYMQEEPAVGRKPRVFLLILYILLAVPLTLVGIVVLLLPTLLFLALAAAVVVSGVAMLIAAFSGFKILADILLLLGCAVVLLALGLLFLWIFVWFIGGVMAGLVSGVIALAKRWCYKEVAA